MMLCALHRLRECTTFANIAYKKPLLRKATAMREPGAKLCSTKAKSQVPAIKNPFADIAIKNKENYMDMVQIFLERNVHRRHHVEFVYAALKSMTEFGVEHDLDVYKSLINVMPKGKLVPTNILQAEFMHYPKQQQCIIDLLEQMEDFSVMPDVEMEDMLLNIFGRRGYPLRKYWRMMYWMPKFRNLSPWPLPKPVPDDALQLAKLAIERMCTVDVYSQVTVFETKSVKDSLEDTWIVSGMSLEQSRLLSEHPVTKAVYIEGPFILWLRNRCINYFILRADADPDILKNFHEITDFDRDDVSQLEVPFFGQSLKSSSVSRKTRSVHQQADGTIFAMCATGTSSKDSLLSWIRSIEKNNPTLANIPIVFRLASSTEKAPAVDQIEATTSHDKDASHNKLSATKRQDS